MNNHNCEFLIVTCIDYRFQEYINKWTAENFAPNTFDRVAIGGGVKNLETILGQIDIACRLHHIPNVVLINHEDCGAYGTENFPDSQVEHQKHAEDLKNATAKINEKYPDLEVETYYLHLDGIFDKV